ncbi:MAG: D-Ala-D-Ala carboxypeptidase family metallohydrolase [Terriglobales bacterium]
MGDLSANFSKTELACPCCGQLKIDSALIDGLEQLRALAGKPVVVHDGYRCPAHNEKVSGVPDSQHPHGKAADVSIPGLSLQDMYELALQVPVFFNGGIGVYDSSFLHLDTRPHAARWARVRGQYVGINHLVTTPHGMLAEVSAKAKSGAQPV